jgi:glycosyltransferase involved in cell wall biosynthesis
LVKEEELIALKNNDVVGIPRDRVKTLDVVIVTLLRYTLGNTIKSVKAVIPNPNIILITGKGNIGELRNKGLLQCTSELMCFVDDDIILNKNWYTKCMQIIQARPEIVAVCGKTPVHHTLGCMICRTQEFKRVGGFPQLDDYVLRKLGPKILSLEDAVCEHHVKRGFGPLQHNLHFLCHGFQTEKRAGWCNDPKKQVWITYGFFKAKYPDYAVGSFVWLIKLIFAFPFILEDKIDQNKLRRIRICEKKTGH